MPPVTLRPRRGVVWLFIALFALIWFANLDYRKLIRTDEGRYAEIAREMAVSGDWITPRSNDFKYFYKPPLQYWATAAAFKVFGENEWTARLWTALCGFAGVLITGLWSARVWGAHIGFLSALILAGSIMWTAMGHFAALDMSLAFFLAAAVAAFAAGQRDEATAGERRRLMLFGWAAAALAVLSKGLIGIVLPGASLVVYALWARDFRVFARLEWLRGLALFLVIAAPWFVAVSLANPEFAHYFFIHEHFERFLTKVHGRYGPPWYFIPVLIAGLLPWTLFLGHVVRAGLVRTTKIFQPERFLLVWVVTVFLFFSASSSKLVSYILPIFPALAVLTALGLQRSSPRLRRWVWGIVALGGLAVALATPGYIAQREGFVPRELLEQYSPWIVAAGIVVAIGGVLAFLLDRGDRLTSAVVAAAFAGLVGAQLAISGHERLAPVFSAYDIAQKVAPALAPDTPFFMVSMYDHTLPFYLRRTMTLVAVKDELEQAIAWEPEKFIPDMASFRIRWDAAPRAAAVMQPDLFHELQAAGFPMIELARDLRRVIVAKPGDVEKPGQAP